MRLFQGSEDPARQLINHIAELQTRLAHPQHWTEGENTNNTEKLRQLRFELRRRQSLGEQDPLEEDVSIHTQ